MPPISVEEGGGGSSSAVGIIYPPPEVRNIVDKTASFVARNGPEFEQRIKQNEINNPKFNFLGQGDPYHAYYQHRVKEIREGKDDEKAVKVAGKGKTAAAGGQVLSTATDAMKHRQSELLKQVQKDLEPPPPKDPPPDFEFLADPPSISAFDLDVVKLTAQFVARNGRQFLTNLMQKEQRNYQFDFLRPQHALFQYFTKLLEQYTKVLIPPKDLMRRLNEEGQSEKKVLEQIDYRVRWVKHQEAKKRREAEELERERVSYGQIDWHNFVVVETVDYQPWEAGSFPPPTNPTEVGARVLMQRRVETMPSTEAARQSARMVAASEEEGVAGESNTNVEDMDEDSSSSEDDDDEEGLGAHAPTPMGKPLMAVDAAPAVHQPPPNLPTPGNVEVRKYDPKMAKARKPDPTSEEFLVSPITGEHVPASKVQEHMRIGLLDPRWVEERDKQITQRASEDQVFAPGQAIEHSLKHLAERRTDIFGVGEEAAQETGIGRKMGEEERRGASNEGNTWDGHSSSAEAAARAARANISLNDQIEQIHRSKGLLVDKDAIGPKVTHEPPQMQMNPVVVSAPPMAAMPQMVPMMHAAPPMMAPPPPQQFYVPAFHPHPVAPPMAPPPSMPMGMGMPPPMDPFMLDMDEPASKRPRGEEHLMPETEFMAMSPSPVVTFRVLCPVLADDKSEWRLGGQVLQVTLPLSETLAAVKARLHEETGMPPGKQKLQLDALFLKDANTLAYYNIRPGMMMGLQIKERGGRKK